MSLGNILFYSNNCDESKLLLSMMQNENLVRFFHLVCTDNNPKIPPQITVTPTLILKNLPTPYVAGDAFSWLAKIKQAKANSMLQKVNVAQQQFLQKINNNLATPENNSILGFSQAEMNSMSDIFAFFSTDTAFPQTYFECNNFGQESIFTPPMEDGTYKVGQHTKYRITESKQKELQNAMESERKKQDEIFKQSIEGFRKQYAK